MADPKEVLQGQGSNDIRTRWVVCNKGDTSSPDIRARLVACEVNTYKSEEFFASTTPLEAKRLHLSELATRRKHADGGAPEVMFIDVKKA